jgi:vacuolar-type H+-ATPase subunit I/STV1
MPINDIEGLQSYLGTGEFNADLKTKKNELELLRYDLEVQEDIVRQFPERKITDPSVVDKRTEPEKVRDNLKARIKELEQEIAEIESQDQAA